MAIPISKTVLQLFLLSGGGTCPEVLKFLDDSYPNWDERTVIDAYTWCEQMRNAGMPNNANLGIYRGLSSAQQNSFLSWLLSDLLSIVPEGYAQLPLLQQLNTNLNTLFANNTANNKTLVSNDALSITQDPDVKLDITLTDVFYRVGLIYGNGINLQASDLDYIGYKYMNSYRDILGVERDVSFGKILTKLEQIIGIV